MNTTARQGALIASKILGTEVNAKELKHTVVCACRKEIAGQDRNRNIEKKSSKEWKNSNTSKRHQHIIMAFMQKLRAD